MSYSIVSIEEIEHFIEHNTILLSNTFSYTTKSGGGFKELLYSGGKAYITIPITVFRMKYDIGSKVGMFIDEETHNQLMKLSHTIQNSINYSFTHISYEGSDSYKGFWVRGNIEGFNGIPNINVILNTKTIDDDGNDVYTTINIEDCPLSYKGYGCLDVKGLYFKDIKDIQSDIYLRTNLVEILIEEVEIKQQSKILLALGRKTPESVNNDLN